LAFMLITSIFSQTGDEMMKRLFLMGIISVIMAFALALTGCPTDGDDGTPGGGGGGGGGGGLTITPASTALEVVWPKSGDLGAIGDYHVRYKAIPAGSTDTDIMGAGTTNIVTSQATAASFKADITLLVNDTTYKVWIFRNTDAATFTTATPLYMGTGTPVAPTQVTLASKSHGTAAANSIRGLDSTAKYVVRDETNASWHPVANNGDLGIGGTLDAAITATVNGSAAIGNLNNNRTYNVVLVKVFADSGSLTAADISKNSVADISALTANKTLIISSPAGGNAATLYVYTGQANDAAIGSKTIAENDLLGAAAGKRYNVTGATLVGSIQITAAAAEQHATIDLTSAIPPGASITITVQ
jgi:hypothetical protein